jgi:transposase
MDNAKYHSRHLIKKPSQATRKDEILNFMASHNIAVPQKNTKKDLLEILKNHDIPQQYVVDETAKEKGHTVLRLPPYYCVLNPIELIWSSLKGRCQIAARIEGFKILSTKLQRMVSLGLNNLM